MFASAEVKDYEIEIDGKPFTVYEYDLTKSKRSYVIIIVRDA